MKQVDYLVVGFGLAGMAFCDQLEQHNKTFYVIDQKLGAASRVAAGIINPVTLKRYTMPWKAEEQFDLAVSYFNRLNKRFDCRAVEQLAVHKVFSSIEDQNDWFEATDKPGLNRFLKPSLLTNTNTSINAPLHLGEVLETLRVDIPVLLDAYANYLTEEGFFAYAKFKYDALKFHSDYAVIYENVMAKHVVFAEGFGVKENPFFNKLPLVGNKGEYLIIEAPDLKLSKALKASYFITPVEGDLYKVGATFNWKEKDLNPTEESKNEIVSKLKKVITCDFTVVDQQVGIRPTTGDRRPLIGVHPNHKQLVLLNGLGTRGTMMSPYLAAQLYKHLEMDIPLDNEASLIRFPKKF